MFHKVMIKSGDHDGSGGVEETDVEGFVLRIAAIAEQSSNHPLSRAIMEVSRSPLFIYRMPTSFDFVYRSVLISIHFLTCIPFRLFPPIFQLFQFTFRLLSIFASTRAYIYPFPITSIHFRPFSGFFISFSTTFRIHLCLHLSIPYYFRLFPPISDISLLLIISIHMCLFQSIHYVSISIPTYFFPFPTFPFTFRVFSTISMLVCLYLTIAYYLYPFPIVINHFLLFLPISDFSNLFPTTFDYFHRCD